jgi:hypothetical protein
MLKKVLLCLAIATSGAMAQAHEDAPEGKVRAGSLICEVGPSIGLVLFSTPRKVTCTYSRAGGLDEVYKGTMKNIGINAGITAGSVIEWLVFVATDSRGENNLMSGTYAGKELNGSIGLGGGVNFLVGGFNKSVSLQPWSIQQQVGVNFNWSLVKMKLHKVR